VSKQTIPFTDRATWLAERSKDVTSTEVSALFGLSPYSTEFELWHAKKNGIVAPFVENNRVRWGNRLEPVIAQGIAEDHGWTIRKKDEYVRDTVTRMGASFDYEVKDVDNVGVLEIKNVDWKVFKDQWSQDGESVEAPPHIEMQVQHQLDVADIDWAAIGVLVGGNEPRVIFRKRDRGVGTAIRQRVAIFWDSVERGVPPKPDYVRDSEFITKQLRASAHDGETVEVGSEIAGLLAEYSGISKQVSELEERRSAIKAMVLDQIGTASKVLSPFGTLTAGMTKDSQGTLITPDMVGTYVGARSGYRQFRYTPKKEKS
jgi:putative phage-type endonuclease